MNEALEIIRAFEEIDQNGNGSLSSEELPAAFREHHCGNLDVELISV
ncbi:EF-hand domain-containing protein [Saccharothrix deserti]